MRVGTRAKIFAGVALLSGCSLFVDTSGLTGGGGSNGGDSGDGGGSGDGSTQNDGSIGGDGSVATIPDLAVYFPFDEGSGNAATDHGPNAFIAGLDPNIGWAPGHTGNAVSFPGDGGAVFVKDEPGLSIGSPATIAFWINADDVPGSDERLMAMGYSWDIKLNGSGEIPQFSWNEDDAGGGYISPINPLVMGEWHHIAFTFDPTSGAAVYLDGRLQNNDGYVFTPGNILRTDTYGFTIGEFTGGTRSCKCRIDELRLYKRALTANEIKEIAQ